MIRRCWRVIGQRRKGGTYRIVITASTSEEAFARADYLMGTPTALLLLHAEQSHEGGVQLRAGQAVPSPSPLGCSRSARRASRQAS
jgi:hypothetical protein